MTALVGFVKRLLHFLAEVDSFFLEDPGCVDDDFVNRLRADFGFLAFAHECPRLLSALAV